MFVAVVAVGIMRVRVFEALVLVGVSVGFAGRIVWPVAVAVVLIVPVAVVVSDDGMNMQVIVTLGQVQVDADQHQRAGRDRRRG